MNQYNKLQKFLSLLLIFSTFFSFTFNVSFFSFIQTIFAQDDNRYNIVSIFVQDDLYNGGYGKNIKNEINTYSRNIQNTLENTKVLIFPVPTDINPFNIASLNEKLYFEGYKGLNGLSGDSQLVGTVFVGNIPLPVVKKNGSFEKTVLPYVDFQDKLYVYNHENNLYEYAKDIASVKSEIWHGFISPNTGNKNVDLKQLKDYFSKNNDFYKGQGNFKTLSGSINLVENEKVNDNYEPYVFYYDQIRTQKAFKYVDYKAYEAYIKNSEDISYDRYTKGLTDKLKNSYQEDQVGELDGLKDVVGTGTNLAGTDLPGDIPDILNKKIIEKTTKTFLDTVNPGTLGDQKKDVHNAGRYNTGTEVNVDLLPQIIANLDAYSQAIIKDVNNSLENYIDEYVKKTVRNLSVLQELNINFPGEYQDNTNWSGFDDDNSFCLIGGTKGGSAWGSCGNLINDLRNQNIAFRTEYNNSYSTLFKVGYPGYSNKNQHYSWAWTFSPDKDDINTFGQSNGKINVNYYNIINKNKVSNFTSPWDCTVNRGSNYNSGQLVKASICNTIYIQNTGDKNYCKDKYDINGSKLYGDKNPEPTDCNNDNITPNIKPILNSIKSNFDEQLKKDIQEYNSLNGCVSDIEEYNSKLKKEEEEYLKDHPDVKIIEPKVVDNSQTISGVNSIVGGFMGGNFSLCNTDYAPVDLCNPEIPTINSPTIQNFVPSTQPPKCMDDYLKNYPKNQFEMKYVYKSLPGYMIHKSPTDEELEIHNKSMIIPNLAIDKNRYIDFISMDGSGSTRYEYPYLFRFSYSGSDLNLSNIKKQLSQDFSKKNTEMVKVKPDLYKYIGNILDTKIMPTAGNCLSNQNYKKFNNYNADGTIDIDWANKIKTYSTIVNGGSAWLNEDKLKLKLYEYFKNKDNLKTNITNISGVINYFTDYQDNVINNFKSDNSSFTGELISNDLSSDDCANFKQSLESLVLSINIFRKFLNESNYEDNSFNLNKYIESKPIQTLNILGKEKKLSYLDTLAFALYWKNLNSTGAKTKYIFENYLSDQFGNSNIDNGIFLPKNKSEYEIAYLSAPGDSKNMYIKLDPEEKSENPYADIIASGTTIGDFNISPPINSDDKFKCAPPEGVPLNEWWDAIMCRRDDLVKQYKKFQWKDVLTQSSCSSKTLFTDDDGKNEKTCSSSGNTTLSSCVFESFKNGSLKLKTDSEKYYYNKTGVLEAQVLDKDNKIISDLSNVDVNFEITKLVVPKDETKAFENNNKKEITNQNEINKYINFNSGSVKLQNGIAKYNFVTRTKDIDVTFKISINYGEGKKDGNFWDPKNWQMGLDYSKEKNTVTPTFEVKQEEGEKISFSDTGNVQVRGDLFYSASYKLSEFNTTNILDSGINSLIASDKINVFLSTDKTFNLQKNDLNNLNAKSGAPEKIFITLLNKDKNGNDVGIDFPINIDIFKDGEKIGESKNIPNLVQIKELGFFKEAGSYIFEISDKYKNTTKKEIEVLPGDLSKIDLNLSTNLAEKGGVITNNMIILSDNYGNVAKSKLYEIKAQIDGNSVTFDDNTKSKTFETFEGFKLFKLKTTSAPGVSTIKITVGKIDVAQKLNVVNGLNITLGGINDLKVGNIENKLTINLQNKSDFPGFEFNSRAYFAYDKNYLSLKQDYISIKDGFGTGSLFTNIKSGKKVPITLYVEGVKNPIVIEKEIKPEVPVKINLNLSKTKLEANNKDITKVYAELKDIYGNIVYNNDNKYKLNLDIDPKYKSTIFYNNESEFTKELKDGKAEFVIKSTFNPGIGYFKISSYPSLSENKMIFKSGTGETIISGVGESVGKVESYFFWNSKSIVGKNYNSIYTTLIGAPYGDITTTGSLANSIIFDKNNKALAVSTMLNYFDKKDEVINLKPDGNIFVNNSSSDLSQDVYSDVKISNQKEFYLDFVNKTYNELIGKVFFNFKDSVGLKNCLGNLENCYSKDENSISIHILDDFYKVYQTTDVQKFLIKDNNGNVVFEINNFGKIINKSSDLTFEINNNYKTGLVLNLKLSGKDIALLGINFYNSDFKIIRSIGMLDQVKSDQDNGGVILYIESRNYATKDNYLGNSTVDKKGVTIFYNDQFSSQSASLSDFSKDFEGGYENYMANDGIGWKEGNKTLLSFAAGKTVGEATKDYQTFNLINIGDPVISLKSKQKDLPGTIDDKRNFDSTIGTLISKDENNLNYAIFDYNNDKIQDIAILKKDGHIELLEGTGIFGDYINRGNIVYFVDIGQNNTIESGDFNGDGYDDLLVLDKNKNPILISNNGKDFTRVDLNLHLEGQISQIISYDMDLDKMYDLVTLDDNGDIKIHYGTNIAGIFNSKIVGVTGKIKLSQDPRNDNGLIYFDGSFQLPQKSNIIPEFKNNDLLNQIKSNISKINKDPKSTPVANTISDPDIDESMIDNSIFVQTNYLTGATSSGTNLITFIKSEYSKFEGVDVSKTYTNLTRTGGVLKGFDKVRLDIKISNTSSKLINNIVYLEKIPSPFILSKNPEYNLNIGTKSFSGNNLIIKTPELDDYQLLLDDYKDGDINKKLSLEPNTSLTFSFILDTGNFSFGNIEVGNFDDTTPHGDINLKAKAENCSGKSDIFKSIDKRSYQKGVKNPICKADGNKPKELIDEDGNGVPDYIDSIINGSTEDKKKYAQEQLALLQSESKKDISFMDKLSDIDKNTDEILAEVDKIAATLNCGFGGAGCLSVPFNRAPLAPGQDPVIMGYPVGDGFHTFEGLPTFSAITYGPVNVFGVPIPPFWPTNFNGAGGRFGYAPGPVRIFVTPTLTGAMGTAICFGDNVAAGYGMFPGLSPLLPGGNCIVATKSFLGCKNDGSDGDIASTGEPSVSGDDFGIINGNCSTSSSNEESFRLSWNLVEEYIKYKKGELEKSKISSEIKQYLKDTNGKLSKWLDQKLCIDNVCLTVKEWDENGKLPTERKNKLPQKPLISVGDGSASSGDTQVDLKVDLGSISDGNFGDIVKIQMKRVSVFPGFIMDWVTSQIEEIVTKLTSFPTLFVILPDFSGIIDSGWKDIFSGNVDLKNKNGNVESGIRGVYEFLGNLPMVSLSQQKVNLDIPWIDKETVDLKILERKNTIKQRNKELEKWTTWIEKCKSGEQKFSIEGIEYSSEKCSYSANISKLINSIKTNISLLDKNIEILESYKKFPEQLNKLINKKEIRLEQVLCNIESISSIMGGWIGENGKIFKSWVDLYVLVKAILKSWQLVADVFIDFSAECHECKNERNDSQTFIWSLISMILPKVPIFTFPKWPDIYLDFHNIKAGINVSLPEFEFNKRPILLPNLPALRLPDSPDLAANISIGDIPLMPLLPSLELPELPDLPSLPQVKLPNLPPAPKLPKIPSELSGVLKIFKLITKAMCLLKASPFVPEWRAGDHIAFLTESAGLRSTDFLNLSLPQFSYPMVDAFKVTTYVNLEFDTDYLVEMARQIAIPLNAFGNDIVGLLDISLGNLDFSNYKIPDLSINADFNLKNADGTKFDFNTKYNLGVDGQNIELTDENIEKIKNAYLEKRDAFNKSIENLDWEKIKKDILNGTADYFTKDLKNNWKDVSDSWVDFRDTFTLENLQKLSEVAGKKDAKQWNEFIDSINETGDQFNKLFEQLNQLDWGKIGQDSIDYGINKDILEKIQETWPEIKTKIIEFKKENPSSYNNKKVNLVDLAGILSFDIVKLMSYINNNKNSQITTTEFKDLIKKELSNKELYKDERYSKITGLWKDTLNYSFSKEDKLINDLLNNNKNKFKDLKDILNTEIEENKKLKNNLKNILSTKPNYNLLLSDSNKTNIQAYNNSLKNYNTNTINSLNNLFKPDYDAQEIKKQGRDLISRVNNGVSDYKKDLIKDKTNLEKEINKNVLAYNSNINNKLLAANTDPITASGTTTNCETKKSDYDYKYEGIYVVEKSKTLLKNISYRLFDYLDELSGKELLKGVDVDSDGDEDIFYMVGNEIFLKQNLSKNIDKKHFKDPPIRINKNSNLFLKNNYSYIEAVNQVKEGISDNKYINIAFNSNTDNFLTNYRLEIYNIVDKFSDIFAGKQNNYYPQNLKKFILDAFVGIQESTQNQEKIDGKTFRNNLVYIDGYDFSGLKVTTKEMKGLKNVETGNVKITINSGTKLYSTNQKVKIKYYIFGDTTDEKQLVINKNTNVSFDYDIILTKIEGYDLYVEGKTDIVYNTPDEIIKNVVNKPLFPGFKIENIGNSASKVNVNYYDGSFYGIDFSTTSRYEIYDLGPQSKNYLIRTDIENDFYYARMQTFKWNKFSSYSNQILLSPQQKADNISPEIDGFGGFKTPVYQTKTYDLTDAIFENSGIKGIKNIYVDFDLTKDTNGDGDNFNDKDFEVGKTGTGFNISITDLGKIIFKVGPFDKLINKQIRVYVGDENGNIGFKDVDFTIYSPNPEITNVVENNVIGRIDEELNKEPVSFYKIRGGSLSRLKDTQNFSSGYTSETGSLNFAVQKTLSGLELKENNNVIAKINEDTGKIDTTKLGLQINVYASNDKNHNSLGYPRIAIINAGETIYYEYLATPNIGNVNIVNDFINNSQIGVYYKHENSNYTYSQLPLNISYNAGDLVILDESKKIISTVFKDGRINLEDGYNLAYSYFGNYVVFEIKKGDNIIGKVMVIPEKNYILK